MLRADRRGVAALEYGLLASIVGAAVIASAFHYAPAEESLFSAINLTVSRVTGSLAAGAGGGTTAGPQGVSGGGTGNGQSGGSGEDDGESGR